MDLNIELLAEKAIEAKEHAYVPYSHFRVGAALLTADGKIIRDATSKMPRTHRRTVRSGRRFSRRYPKGSVILRQSPSAVTRTIICIRAACADR